MALIEHDACMFRHDSAYCVVAEVGNRHSSAEVVAKPTPRLGTYVSNNTVQNEKAEIGYLSKWDLEVCCLGPWGNASDTI